MLTEGWTIGSVDYGAPQVRTGHCLIALLTNDELAFGFEPNFFIAADGTIACVPDFPSASGDVIMGRLDPSGGRVH